MILLCGIPSEGPVASAIAAAREAAVPHVVLNQRQVDRWQLQAVLDAGRLSGELRGPGGSWDLAGFSGVYLRTVEPRRLPDLGDPVDEGKLSRAEALHGALLAWAELAPCRVANRLGPSTSNMSKPYQAQRIAEAGLGVPPTTITNDPDEVRRFAAEHGRVIFKSISSTRSIVRELSGERVKALQRVRHLPTQFQALIPGVDVRVHVVGTGLYATAVRSASIDYRYAAREDGEVRMEPCDLPDEIAGRCLALSAALELPVCGIDLRRTPDGEWYCFEVNPSPAYSYYEQLSGQPIGAALVSYLAGGDGGGGEHGASD